MPAMIRTLAWCAVLLVALAACSKPQPPEKERPPEPQAARHTEMRDAIQAPIDKARNVEADMQKAADAQRAAIDAQME
jgi:hypothetical protein